MKLHEITGDMREVAAIEDMDAQVIADTLEGLEGDFKEKAKSIVAVTTNMSSDIAAIDAEIARLNDRKKTIQNRDKSIRDYLKSNMIASDIKNIKCPLFSITLAKGREVVEILDENALPDEFTAVKTDIRPDKKQILDALKAGNDVPGARLAMSQPSLRIK